MSVRLLTIKISQWARENLCCYLKKNFPNINQPVLTNQGGDAEFLANQMQDENSSWFGVSRNFSRTFLLHNCFYEFWLALCRHFPAIIRDWLRGSLTASFKSTGQYGGEMSELDDAGTYFDLGPKKVTGIGTYYYMSTRNNNFSNRSQKGRLIISNTERISRMIGRNGGTLSFNEWVTLTCRLIFTRRARIGN